LTSGKGDEAFSVKTYSTKIENDLQTVISKIGEQARRKFCSQWKIPLNMFILTTAPPKTKGN